MKVKTKLLKAHNVAIAKLLAILGFTSCLCAGCAKYGVPEAEYIVNGQVVSKETLEPIENIRVSTYDGYMFTDNEGNYQVSYLGGDKGATVCVEFRDTADQYRDLDALIEFRDGEKIKTFNVGMTPNDNDN
ncbi:MAG: radical SAM-associated putative lipoprotein [Bacteroidales bacterium]|nr:radical SAM-associated putative lipoprotein [Bacteroidales bacterium]